ncbi:MAG: FAD:protein FMN transferase [Acidimicrobiales bacterium]|nr:FAD:protein FMN transferase [Acidimicrobiales bacterium]
MPSDVHVVRHEPLLGTVVDVRVIGSASAADLADRAVVTEVERLQRIFSAYDPGSELCRWRRGEQFTPSPELVEVLALALDWQRRSEGRFNPLAGELAALWRDAAAAGSPPDADRLAETARAIRTPRYEVGDGVATTTGDCTHLELNAVAKGYIVDRSLAVAWASVEVDALSVNAGGDLAHRGARPVKVGVENPLRPYDNEPPIAVVEVADAAVATSGSARRGVRIAGRWYPHVFDARSGQPVDAIASITVVAADATTADLLTTVAGTLPAAAAIDQLAGLGCTTALVVDRDGNHHEGTGWGSLVVR